MKLSFLSLSFSAFILLTSCTKDEVSAGNTNQGGYSTNPYGYNNSTSVNVIASDWISASAMVWSDASGSSDAVQHSYLNAIELSQEIIDNSAVLVYAKKITDGSAKLTPATFHTSDTTFESYNVIPEPFAIHVLHSSYHVGAYTTPVSNNDISFRYILFENLKTGNSTITSNSGINYNFEDLKQLSYNELVSLLGIID